MSYYTPPPPPESIAHKSNSLLMTFLGYELAENKFDPAL